MTKTILLAVLILGMIPLTTTNGKFYVGFLGYNNKENLRFDGECCDGVRDGSGRCDVTCDLVFQVSVYGLDRGNMTNKRPSRLPINDTNSFIFSDEYKHAVNPITFDFRAWPGKVRLVVQVFDQDHVAGSSNNTLEVVDEMDYVVDLAQPNVHFIYQNITGIRSIYPSKIMLLFRYECGPTYYGHDCLTDCLMYPTNPLCPRSTTITMLSTLLTQHSVMHPSTEPTSPLTDCSSRPFTKGTDITTKSTASVTPEMTEFPLTNTDMDTSTTESTSTSSLSPTHNSSTPSHHTTSSTASHTTTEMTDANTNSTDTVTDPSTDSGRTIVTPTSTDSIGQVTDKPTDSGRTIVTPTSTDSTGQVTNTPTDSGSTIVTPTSTDSTDQVTDTATDSGSTIVTPTSSLLSTDTTSRWTDTSTPETIISETSASSVLTLRTSDSSTAPQNTDWLSSSASYVDTTTLDPQKGSTKDPKDFALQGSASRTWPIIVGCVVGGVVLTAIIIFFVYQNRQKRMRKRQEIYNVSPEVISVIEENGTTERSDVPITTSPL